MEISVLATGQVYKQKNKLLYQVCYVGGTITGTPDMSVESARQVQRAWGRYHG